MRRGCLGLAFAVGGAIASSAVVARAQVTTQERGSVLVFPKVVADGTWDTTIQIAAAVNHPVYAHCFYINGALTPPTLPPGPSTPPLWTQTDFVITLERQQPTHWTASRGRLDDPVDQGCTTIPDQCDGAGLDPGAIPPVPASFTGELRCIELDASGAPWSGNGLRGEATLTQLATGEVVKYPGASLRGLPANDADGNLCLGGAASEPDCRNGAEYTGCPQTWIVSHPSDYDSRPTDGDARTTRLTVVPCATDLLTQQPTRLSLRFVIATELEQTFSVSTTIECWAEHALSDINPLFQRDVLGADWVQTRVGSAASTPGGFLVVQQSERATARPALFAATATVPQQEGVRAGADLIRLPEGSPR